MSIFGQVNDILQCLFECKRVCLIMFEMMVLGSNSLLSKTHLFLEWLLYYILFMYFCGVFYFQVQQCSCFVVLVWSDKYHGTFYLQKVLMSEAVLLVMFYFAS